MSAATSTIVGIGLGVGGAAASVGGSLIAKSGADKAADSTLKAAQLQVDENKRQFDVTQQNQAPWLGTGAAAEGRLSYLLGLNPTMGNTQASFKANYGPQGTAYLPGTGGVPAQGATSTIGYRPQPNGVSQKALQLGGDYTPRGYTGGINPNAAAAQPQVPGVVDPEFGSLMKDFTLADFNTDPGYQFRLAEGQKALDRSAAAKGGLFSGEQLKANDRYNQGFASNEFNNAYNRFQNNRTTKYNFLAAPAGLGQQTAQQLGQLGADYSNINSNLTSNANNIAGQYRTSGYGALAGGIGSAIPTALAGYNATRGYGYGATGAYQGVRGN